MNNCKIYEYDAVVVGTGAAGYSGACRIRELGQKTVAIVTASIACGTSRNTGSDKQTYYKLGLGGDAPDSVRNMAQNLFAGGSVDGDNALCEAALSVRCFLRLAELGVPFPVNCYGEYIGYKTDHDPYARATSAGPLTSRFMTEALERQAQTLQIPVYDGLLAIEILRDETGVCGLLCMEQSTGDFVLFRCGSILLATGGPAGIYADSVYPIGHTGASGLLLEAGAAMQNLTEWQFGLASVAPRWNVSGTYMQVLPRFVSVDAHGTEREFLSDYFEDPYEALSAVFLKGYQWPFDSRKVFGGSSVIDLLVYRECVMRHRKVYLDYTKNPFGLGALDFGCLSPEAHDYLARAGACFGTPIERL
ncbi:MAG: FAD-binding protein, partial [Clostridia bacterium]|nr:FAD-binding protein [Clostridia bacterium]